MALLKALQSFSREAWVLTRKDEYLLFKTQISGEGNCDEADGVIAEQKSKRQTRMVGQTCAPAALTTTAGLVSVLTSIQPLRASGSAQLSSHLVHQVLGCLQPFKQEMHTSVGPSPLLYNTVCLISVLWFASTGGVIMYVLIHTYGFLY